MSTLNLNSDLIYSLQLIVDENIASNLIYNLTVINKEEQIVGITEYFPHYFSDSTLQFVFCS